MTKWPLLTFTAVAMSFAAGNTFALDQPPTTPEPLVLPSAAPQSCWGWYAFADALYWKASVGSAEWSWSETSTGTFTTGPLNSTDFNWHWGVRGGVGFNMDYDAWDSNLTYTWFSPSNSQSASVIAAGTLDDLIGAAFDQADLYSRGTANWKMFFSMFDWELGRWSYISPKIALRPHIGLKGGWINQHVRYNFVTTASITGAYTLDNDFWGIGPAAGINSSWILAKLGSCKDHRFTLFGDVGGALMYGHFDVTHTEDFFNAAGSLIDFNRPTHLNLDLAVPMLQGIMGLGYDTGWNQDKLHFALRAGYELQYWFRQYQQVRGVQINAAHGYNRFASDLALQGLTVDVRLDF